MDLTKQCELFFFKFCLQKNKISFELKIKEVHVPQEIFTDHSTFTANEFL